MKQQSLAKNFIFQFSYQLLTMLLPLILSPYLTRTLGGEALGTYSYINSIAYYFFLFANLGIVRHGQRIISQNREDDFKLRIVFWSLMYVHMAASLLSIVGFSIFILFVPNSHLSIYVIHLLYLFSALFDVTWLFYGLENFQTVIIRNVVVKLAECFLIFTLIKDSSDLWLYATITNGGFLLSSLVLLPFAINIIKPIKISIRDFKQHIKPMLIFSISTIAVSFYTIFDKTLLGLLSSMENVAYYEYSYKVVMVPIVLCSVIGTVMFPRACRLASLGDTKGQRNYFELSIILSTAISCGAFFGLMAVSDLLAIEYYGNRFSICGHVMVWLAPMIFIASAGDIIRTQYLIPNGMDNEYVKCVIYNAIINIIISTSLIPKFGIAGAVIGTETAELFGLIYQAFKCRKLIAFRELFYPLIPYSLLGIIMCLFVKGIGFVTGFNLSGLMIQICFGLAFYTFLCSIYLYFSNRSVFMLIFRKIPFLRRINK